MLISINFCSVSFNSVDVVPPPPFGWCCLSSPPLGGCFSPLPFWVVPLSPPSSSFVVILFSPLPFGLVLPCFRRCSTTQRRRRKAARPKDGGGQAAPPKRRGAGTTTQLNWAYLAGLDFNLENESNFIQFLIRSSLSSFHFLKKNGRSTQTKGSSGQQQHPEGGEERGGGGESTTAQEEEGGKQHHTIRERKKKTAPPKGGKGWPQSHPQGRYDSSPTQQKEWRRQHHRKRGETSPPPSSFWEVVRARPRCLLLLPFDGAVFLCLLWVARPFLFHTEMKWTQTWFHSMQLKT